MYPILALMARHYLAIPATSVPSEQIFSQAGNIATKLRNRLQPETLEYILCVQSWLRYPEVLAAEVAIEDTVAEN